MTHVAWVPPQWLDAAETTLAGMAERHPSRTLILVPDPGEPAGLDAEVSVRCFPVGESHVCGEVIELRLRGNRAAAPASLVLPLAISDLPVFCRWRGQPSFGESPWEQLVDVADRVIVDSSEWETLAYGLLAGVFERTAVSDLVWARTYEWRVELARYWPAISEQEIRVRGPRADASLLARVAERAPEPRHPPGRAGRGARCSARRRGPSAAECPHRRRERAPERRARPVRPRRDVRGGRAGRGLRTRLSP